MTKDSDSNEDSLDPTINLGNIIISGEDVLLHYNLTKIILRFASKNEVMSHKLIGLLEAVKHGLLNYTDMICVTGELEETDDDKND